MTFRLGWCTDIHLNFLNEATRFKFYNDILSIHLDALMITGDIAESADLCEKLKEMMNALKIPIYFILGNHDFWHSSVKFIRDEILWLCSVSDNLIYLYHELRHKLTEGTYIVGVDGFADGRIGDYKNSDVTLWDSMLIKELCQNATPTPPMGVPDKKTLLKNMKKLADNDAKKLHEKMYHAANTGAKRLIVATHVPPFAEVSKYRGEQSDKNFLPFYSSKCIGDVLHEFALKYSDIKIEVYCGDTHGAAFYQPLHNLTVEAGAAEYRYPVLQKVIELENIG